MINDRLISYLLAIAEEKSITKAAQKLYISQPALSKMLLELEHELGTALFIRERGHLQLSRAGEIYLDGCRKVLSISDSVHKQISDITSGKIGQITVGFTTFTAEAVFPRVILPFEKEYPGIKVFLTEERTPRLIEMVRNGEIDMAFLYQVDPSLLDTEIVLEDTIYIQVPDFLIRTRSDLHYGVNDVEILPRLLMGASMVLLKEGRGMRALADRFFQQNGIQPGRIIETENLHLANRLTCMDKGFTFIPGVATNMLLPHSIYCKIQGNDLKRKLFCCYRKGRYISTAEKYLNHLISSLIRP